MKQTRINPGEGSAVFANNLVKNFGTNTAVNEVSIEVQRGEIFGLLGPNGAGKTTLLRMLATLLPIDGGQAKILGYDVKRQPHQVRQLIGLTGQYASVDEGLTAIENLWMFGRLQGLSSKDAKGRAWELLEQFSLEDAASKALSKFSGGMRRRLDLATSLITHPPLVFLDEPTTGLDPRTRGQMWDTIRQMTEEGTTILLTTQYLDEADQLANRIAVIDRGRKIAEGTPDQLKSSIGASTLQVDLANVAASTRAAEMMSNLIGPGANPQIEFDRVSATLKSTEQATEVISAMQLAGIKLTALQVSQPSLDQVFLTITDPGIQNNEETA